MYLSVMFMRPITGKGSGSHSRQEAGSPQSRHSITAYTGNMKKSPAVHPAGDFHHLPVHFFLYPHLHGIAVRVIEWPLLILGVGAYVGVFLVDLVHSLHLMQRVKEYAVQKRTHVNLDQLKRSARDQMRREGVRRSPFSFYGMLNRYMFDNGGYRDEIRRKWGGSK